MEEQMRNRFPLSVINVIVVAVKLRIDNFKNFSKNLTDMGFLGLMLIPVLRNKKIPVSNIGRYLQYQLYVIIKDM